MKNLKLALFSLALSLLLITSCTNDNEPVDQNQQQTEESVSITNALAQLRTQFDANGNVTQTDNPAGNIVLDFCFDFVYPLTLSYNNGTTVTVNDLDGIISILISSTNELYISGIAFPFNVEVLDDDTDTIQVVTINNEEEFIDLIEDCDFDDTETCECFEVYDPVCVEITSPNGNTFIVTYPNECYAECDGFNEDDFVEDCEEDYYSGGGNECFDFNFPLDIIIENGDVITVNSLEDFGNTVYDVYDFDFVYPFTVSVYDDGEVEVETIEDAEDLEDLLEDCYDDYDDDDDDNCEYDISSLENALITSCELYEIELYEINGNVVNEYYVNFNPNGELIVTGEITVTDTATWNITSTDDDLILNINGLQNFALLNGSWNFDCDDDDLEFYNTNYVIELDCEGDDESCSVAEIEDALLINNNNTTSDGWSISDFNDSNDFEDYEITFSSDGTLQWMDNGAVFSGTWSVSENPMANTLTLSFSGPNLQGASGEWLIVDCDLPCSITLVSNSGNEMELSRDCD